MRFRCLLVVEKGGQAGQNSRDTEDTLALHGVPEGYRRPPFVSAGPGGVSWGDPHVPSPQYYTCSCILAFIACSVFLRMSLELKVVLLTVALVVYLVLFNMFLCPHWDCCGHSLGTPTKTNDTRR